jgi:7-cyano-7-deazaguanine synthase
MEAMRIAIQKGTYGELDVLCPYQSFSKADIVRKGLALGVDFIHTWSCYKGGARHCGTCGTCVERREAFILAGVDDPTDYEETPTLPECPHRENVHATLPDM